LLFGVQAGKVTGDGPAAGGAKAQFLFLVQHWFHHPFVLFKTAGAAGASPAAPKLSIFYGLPYLTL
jgi:hypothetical protein